MNQFELQDLATELVADGYSSIPVLWKNPLVGWALFQNQLPTMEQLASFPWWKATGIAIVLGRATWQRHPNLWCFEIEAKHRAQGEPWLNSEIPHWLTAGDVVESGGGGLHIYCQASKPVETRFHSWGEARGERSICVLPPSRHPSGNAYRWLSQAEPLSFDPDDIPGITEGTALNFTEESGPIGAGARNDTIFRLGCRLRRAGLTGDEILAALTVVNASRCRPPLEVDEVAKIAHSTTTYARGAADTVAQQTKRPPLTFPRERSVSVG